jgi:hypothetical protein
VTTNLKKLKPRRKNMKKISTIYMFTVLILIAGCESTQQKAYDLKADTMGTHRIVEIYTEAGEKVATIEDKSMRFEMVGERSVRLWLGDKNEKVMIGNMGFIIRDL